MAYYYPINCESVGRAEEGEPSSEHSIRLLDFWHEDNKMQFGNVGSAILDATLQLTNRDFKECELIQAIQKVLLTRHCCGEKYSPILDESGITRSFTFDEICGFANERELKGQHFAVRALSIEQDENTGAPKISPTEYFNLFVKTA